MEDTYSSFKYSIAQATPSINPTTEDNKQSIIIIIVATIL